MNDPAERRLLLRFFYRDWRPTRLGRLANRFAAWVASLGVSPLLGVLEVRGRKSGQPRSTPVVIATVDNRRHLVSMLGPGSDWVKNVEAAHGDAILRQGRARHPIHLVAVPASERAPILREYLRVATSGRRHFPIAFDAPLSELEAIAERYPVFRILS
jgi:deazaflavin-dependent oxidoreductase (nitroreductase family)